MDGMWFAILLIVLAFNKEITDLFEAVTEYYKRKGK